MKRHPVESIKTWREFSRVAKRSGCGLLKKLDAFPESILVAGCQRSGTTILSRVITQSKGMVNYWFGKDDELAAALILSGYVKHMPTGRYCFQTTYVNDCYQEYFRHFGHNGNKLIWVLRNPFSVVYSMLYNWSRFALNDLFRSCGVHLLETKGKRVYELFGVWGISQLRRACLSYSGKTSQVFELMDRIGPQHLMVVDYDELVANKAIILSRIYEFINLRYEDSYCQIIHQKSLTKSNRLHEYEYRLINQLCKPIFEKALDLKAQFFI